jgi:hypothetical protein
MTEVDQSQDHSPNTPGRLTGTSYQQVRAKSANLSHQALLFILPGAAVSTGTHAAC